MGFLRVLVAIWTLSFSWLSFSIFADSKSPISGNTETGADQFLVAQQEGVAKNPTGVIFTIRLKDNKDRFQQGEIIPVELSLSSTVPKTYQLDGGLYDRGGRLNVDSFHADPADGAVDPLKDQEPSSGGGIRSVPILDEKPYLIMRDLNEYLRFEKPGKYRLYVVSNRVQRQFGFAIPSTSNIVEFTVLPADAEWAKKQLKSAITILEDTKDYSDVGRHEEEVRSAARVIRFLGTDDALRYMVQHFDISQEFGYGLMALPSHSTVVKEMEAGLEQPDCAVSNWYLSILCSCSFDQKYSLRSDPYPGTGDKAKLEIWQREHAKAQLARDEIRNEYFNRLMGAVLEKKGQAKAVSLDTLLTEVGRVPKDRQPLPPDFVAKLPSELARVFFDLPATSQGLLLEFQWTLIKGPEMTPVLKRYYENPTKEKDVYNPTLAGTALKRILEMEPERGRELMLREIAHPTGRVKFELLSKLPDKTLPQMDDGFASALEKSQGDSPELLSLHAKLLSRYATSAVLPRVKAALLQKGNSWPCEVLVPVIAYCLRVDPAFGASELEKALSSPSPDNLANAERHSENGFGIWNCRSRMVGMVAGLYFCPELEALAIKYLEDPDPEIVLDCVETLGKYGTAKAEAALWKRFEKWHDEWKNRAGEMQSYGTWQPRELIMPHQMEMAFYSALASAQGWLADAAKLIRIQSLCLSDSVKQMAVFIISGAEAPRKRISFIPGPRDDWFFEVAQYHNISSLEALKAKLLQYPKGTVFFWSQGQQEEKKAAIFEELKKFLAEHGMRLEE
jgi:hypothetical protein